MYNIKKSCVVTGCRKVMSIDVDFSFMIMNNKMSMCLRLGFFFLCLSFLVLFVYNFVIRVLVFFMGVIYFFFVFY